MFKYPPQIIALVVMKISCETHKLNFLDNESIMGKEMKQLYQENLEYIQQAEADFLLVPEFKKPDDNVN